MRWGLQWAFVAREVICYFHPIVSTSCGSWVIEAGCCRLYRLRRGEGSQQDRQESGQTSLDNSG